MDKDEFKILVKLAGLRINEDEIDRYRSDFEKIFIHIDKIKKLDISDSPAADRSVLKMKNMRPDTQDESISAEEALLNSKSHDNHFFLTRNRK